MQNKAFTKTSVFEFGEKPLSVLQYIADFLGAEIVTDTHGRIVMQKYFPPAQKPVSYTFPEGENALIISGLDIEDSANGTPNRVAVRHQWQDGNVDKQIFGAAVLSGSSPISATNQNRWITKTYDIQDMSPRTQAKADALAQNYLTQATATSISYEFESFYVPISTGDVVRFRYDNFSVDGLVTNIDMDIAPGAKMKIKVRQVRSS